MQLFFIIGLLATLIAATLAQPASGNVCSGTVEKYIYSLQGLSSATGGNDLTTSDFEGNLYYYRPCKPVLQCQSSFDGLNGVCQKDNRLIPTYHPSGSINRVVWGARRQGASTGFIISFQGGEGGRRTDIEFICDSQIPFGTLEPDYPVENPSRFYHLKWATSYACPIGGFVPKNDTVTMKAN